MSQRRPGDPPRPSSTAGSSSERAASISATFLPPISMQNVAYQQAPYLSGQSHNNRGELSSHTNILPPLQPWHGGPNQSGATANTVIQASPTQGSVGQTRRRPGAAPLADILLQDPPSPPIRSPSSSISEAMQISPTARVQPILSTFELHQGGTNPQRSRQEYFDPLRNALTVENEGQVAQAQASGNFSSQPGYNYPPSDSSKSTGALSSSDRARIRLVIRQQPRAARACGHGERDRRVIDPPPILQLLLVNYDPNSPTDRAILRSPFNMVTCLLHSVPSGGGTPESVGQDVSRIHDPNDPGRDLRRLMGSLTTSPFIGKDVDADPSVPENARIGAYYIFSDLSCRQNGKYRLQFTLIPVDMTTVVPGGRAETITTVTSDIFEVYSAKDFPGMLPSSALTKELKRQGAQVPVKKGNEGRVAKKGKRHGSDSDASASDK